MFRRLRSLFAKLREDLAIDILTAAAAVICRRNFARYSTLSCFLYIWYFNSVQNHSKVEKLSFVYRSLYLFFFFQTSLKGTLIVDRSNNEVSSININHKFLFKLLRIEHFKTSFKKIKMDVNRPYYKYNINYIIKITIVLLTTNPFFL